MKASCPFLLPLFFASLVRMAEPSLSLGQSPSQVTTMRTGSGQVLLSESFLYQSSGPLLSLDFGFATTEVIAPGQFNDSFTVSVDGPGGIAYLVTADASGVLWAPFVPGAISVADGAISRQTTPFAVPTEGGQPIGAYELDFQLPPNWVGSPLTIEFDLFDNQNGESSLGYYAVPVPEPANTTLLLLSALTSCYFLRRR